MRVLMVAPEPFFESRGTPISVFQRLLGVASLGHTVDLLTYHLGERIEIPGVQIHRIPRVPFVSEVKPGPSWVKLFLDLLLISKAIIMLISKRYDLIHSHEEAAFFSVVLAALFRTRHLYDMHSNLHRQIAMSRFGGWRWLVWLFDQLERWTIHTCDAVITVGSDLEERVRTVNPAAQQIRIENLPVETAGDNGHRKSVEHLRGLFGLDHRLPVVYTGNFEHYQGIDLLVESARIVGQLHPEALFLLVGGRPEQIEYWRHETRARHVDNWVLFPGPVPMEEVHRYLEIAEILVSPRKEGTSIPLKIYSYLLSGKPIVATDLPAHTEILNDDIAILAPATAESFARGILKLIVSPELRQRLGHRARRFAMKEYSAANYAAKLGQIYQTLEPTTPGLEPSPYTSMRN